MKTIGRRNPARTTNPMKYPLNDSIASPAQGKPWAALAVGFLAAAIFGFDLSLPLGVAGGVPYVAVILFGWWFERPGSVIALAVLCSILTALGYFLSSEGGVPWIVLLNRTLALFAIWVTTVVVIRAKSSETRIRVASDEVEALAVARSAELTTTLATSQESERRFHDMAESASDWFWELGPDLRITYLSDRFREVIGLDPSQFIGLRIEDLPVVNREQSDWHRYLAALKAQRPFRDLVYHRRLDDGSIRYFQVSGKPVFDEDGACTGFRGVTKDVTAHLEMEAALKRTHEELEQRVRERTVQLKEKNDSLRSSEARLRHLASASPAVVYTCDAVEPYSATYISQNVVTQMGFDPNQFTEDPGFWFSHVHQDDGPRILSQMANLFENDYHVHEYRFQHQTGEFRWMRDELRLVRDTEGEPVEIVGTWIDINDRKQADEEVRRLNKDLERRVAARSAELRTSETRLRDAIEALPVAFALYDREDRLTLCNEIYRSNVFHYRDSAPWGATFEEVLRDKLERGHYPAAEGRQDEWLAERLHRHRNPSDPIELKHSNGRWFWINERRTEEGGIVSVSRDITEQKRLEGEVLRQERLATLGQLTATVSHELRNPLGVIRTSAFIAKEGWSDATPRVQRALDRIDRSVVRCDRIIGELLDFTRFSDLETEPTALDSWLESTLAEQVLPSQVELRRDFNMAGIDLSIDRDRIRRAVINLFDNACQAMISPDSENDVDAHHILTVTTRALDDRVEIVFEDTGPGIPADVRPMIFEPLFSTKGFGVGLGLPTVKQILEQHGGDIDIDSVPGQGTRVRLWLPRSPGAPSAN